MISQTALSPIPCVKLIARERREFERESVNQLSPRRRQRVQNAIFEQEMRFLLVDLRQPFAQGFDQRIVPVALVVFDGLIEKLLEHLERHLAVHQIRFIQRPVE